VRAVDAFKGLDCGSFDPEKSDHIHGRAQARLWGGDFRGVKVRGCEACVFGERYQHTCGRARPVRCSVCGWPMAATVQEGCVPGNCSYRPEQGSPEWQRIRSARLEASC